MGRGSPEAPRDPAVGLADRTSPVRLVFSTVVIVLKSEAQAGGSPGRPRLSVADGTSLPPAPQVPEGAALLLSVLRDPALQRPSKAWYLLRVQALQLVACYLGLSSHSLPAPLREQLCAQGDEAGWALAWAFVVRSRG